MEEGSPCADRVGKASNAGDNPRITQARGEVFGRMEVWKGKEIKYSEVSKQGYFVWESRPSA